MGLKTSPLRGPPDLAENQNLSSPIDAKLPKLNKFNLKTIDPHNVTESKLFSQRVTRGSPRTHAGGDFVTPERRSGGHHNYAASLVASHRRLDASLYSAASHQN